jgi:conjugal transfer pilin signal peptidase TrbI
MLKQLSQIKLTKKTCIVAACVLAAIAGTMLIAKNYLCISWTPSLKYTFFYVKSPDSAKKYDYVVFEANKKAIELMPEKSLEIFGAEGKKIIFIKQVSCKEGEYLAVQGKNYYCNNDYIGRAKDKSLAGDPVTNFVFNGIIPEGYIFVSGANINSLDSRYIGFIEKNSLKAVAVPII